MRFRTLLVALAPVVLAAGCKQRELSDGAEVASVDSGRKLDIKRKSRTGVKESSGLGSFTDPATGKISIYVIGDRTYKIGVATYVDPDTDLVFAATDVKDLFKKAGVAADGDSQWEAVNVDGGGTVFAMKEHPTALHAFAPDLSSMLGAITLDVPKTDPISKDWRKDDNSQGEGFILLKQGHVLVLKEKLPPMLIEFGPAGDAPHGYAPGLRLGPTEAFTPPASGSLTVLHAWYGGNSLDNTANDLSEIAADGDGYLYALSDQARAILSITGKSSAEIDSGALLPTGASFRVNSVWNLPKGLDKPEGLVFVEGDRPIVALDDCEDNANCAFTLSRLKDQ